MQHISLTNKKILVTGAAGFISAGLVKELLKIVSPVTVIGIDNMNSYYDISIKEYRLKEIEQLSSNSSEIVLDISLRSISLTSLWSMCCFRSINRRLWSTWLLGGRPLQYHKSRYLYQFEFE